MKALLILCALGLFAPAAYAQCTDPNNIALMDQTIPSILGLGPQAATITSINVLASGIDPETKLNCPLEVHWSNGQVDSGYRFIEYTDQYGQDMASYGPDMTIYAARPYGQFYGSDN